MDGISRNIVKNNQNLGKPAGDLSNVVRSTATSKLSEKSSEFDTKIAVKQGYVLSPLLFSIVINAAIMKSKGAHINIGNGNICTARVKVYSQHGSRNTRTKSKNISNSAKGNKYEDKHRE